MATPSAKAKATDLELACEVPLASQDAMTAMLARRKERKKARGIRKDETKEEAEIVTLMFL